MHYFHSSLHVPSKRARKKENTTVDTSEVILCLYNLFVHIMEIHDMSRSTPIWTTHRIDLNNSVPHAMIIAHTMSFMNTFKGYEHSS